MLFVEANPVELKRIRLAAGLTQLELALVAGVSERTVRNAERGKRLRKDFLEFIAAALEVSLSEVVRSPKELCVHERVVDRFLTSMMAFFVHGDYSELVDIMSPTAELSQAGPADLPFYGHFRGAAIERYYKDVCQPLLEYRTALPEVHSVTVGHNFLSIYAKDSGLGAPNGKVADEYSAVITCQLERERIVSIRSVGETHQIVDAFR